MNKKIDANTRRLKRMHTEAKKLRRDHPGMSYANALKQAGKKVSGRSHPKTKKKVGAKYRVHEVKRIGTRSNGSSGIGHHAGEVSRVVNQHKKGAVDVLNERLQWLLFQIHNEKNAKVKRGLNKQKADIDREIRLLSKK